jgi:hypothetical protein
MQDGGGKYLSGKNKNAPLAQGTATRFDLIVRGD